MTRLSGFRAIALAIGLAGLPGYSDAQANGGGATGASVPAVPFLSLLEGAASFDGTRVVFLGEAVGQAMERGAMTWVNVTDSGGAIGVWMSAEAAASIRTLGSYSSRGDELRVTGTFHRACGEHGGDMDIHADSVVLVRTGERVSHPLDPTRLAVAAALSLAALAAILMLRARDASRREEESSRYRPQNGSARGS